MLTKTVRTLLVLSSYLPVFLVFTLLGYSSYGIWSVLPTLIGVASLLGIAATRWYANTSSQHELRVDSVARKDQEVLAYLVTYVLPLIQAKLNDPWWVASIAVLFFFVLVVFVTSGIIHINPVLSLLGYHVFEVTTPQDMQHTVIIRQGYIPKGVTLNASRVTEEILWVVRK